MSEQISFDRKKGFVALPVEIMDLDLTPGAFRTLAELCRMANTEGFCWPSLHQLSERLGRSRSSISGYIKELRTAKLVDTQEQKIANGYNYRLKYRVTFWQSWRASLRGKTVQKTERSVQPAARIKDSKNQIQINHEPKKDDGNFETLLKEWSRCFTGAPYPLARQNPSQVLVIETRGALDHTRPVDPVDVKEIGTVLAQLWRRLEVPATGNQVTDQASALLSLGYSRPELARVVVRLEAEWPRHWRKPPQPESLAKRIKELGCPSQNSQLCVLKRYYKRWQLAEKTLRSGTPSCSVGT